MSVAGNIYGVVLNDQRQLGRLSPLFGAAPYHAPPQAPVVYMKPRSALAQGSVRVRAGERVVASPTLALLIGRDATQCPADTALECVAAFALAIDCSVAQPDYYRPAIAQQNRDTFLALGGWQQAKLPNAITLRIDGVERLRWPLAQLHRKPGQLIADLSQFMTLCAGDVLMVGLPGDAPQVEAGQSLVVCADGLADLQVAVEGGGR
jgi:5-oxopent-3-ene-1,2,5-tricarboxylate decarboxylase/2-hydroxyhepta-2,4-diene-1,7-dioate isomerase